MKTPLRALLLIFTLVLAASTLTASGAVGIYGIVTRVVFEPNDKVPERIRSYKTP